MSYSVGQVARLTGITVRTLHHYDRIGLLEAADRSGAGYRRYSDADLDRLQHILFYRELGFSLEDVATVLDQPGANSSEHLRRQHELLQKRIARLTVMVKAVEKEMEAHQMGIALTPEEKFEIFGPNYSEDYEAEAQQRWGDTEAWQQSQSRTSKFTKADWQRVKTETDDLNRRLAASMSSGMASDSLEAMDLAQEHLRAIEVFYDCSYAMHRGIGDMYLADERFTQTYEELAPGLARWLRDAIHANADRHE
ncbi:DNA-binding transcriptional regulator, MerR family [Nakamurella panacisegetis]|uniref:DNA-binding transcriptional regulator, MerR family n=1 Tax=Nakamurella panacisegetis TaxID=1090615 RepID=A0A1H0J143_9ACTN|nr:MerR family transcriptional regulator [Nakamurella panacisegetis]SDO37454.1 DNA-binding transcriptional regulator, MerR family [Nakamurella panacisegetis]